uniref:Uncharacterized protein n=1 Tax=Anguilla anguilla TaxID=7936 RepID=A0A0E9S2Q8_ANGAN
MHNRGEIGEYKVTFFYYFIFFLQFRLHVFQVCHYASK